jgi:hypothetical protein
MRVESRINSWGFQSLHDDIDKMVDDCRIRNEESERDLVATVDLEKTFSKETEATHESTSSSSRNDTPNSNWSSEEESTPSDESFAFDVHFPNEETNDKDLQSDPNQKAKMSFPIKLAMIQFMRDPNSPSTWAELVDSFREEKMKETVPSGVLEGDGNIISSDTMAAPATSFDDSESGWANFDDVSIRNHQDVIVEHDFKSQQKCAMDAFIQQPSQDKWLELVQSMRQDRMSQPEVNCPTLLRLESKLEKLEEEASNAESESWDGGLIDKNAVPNHEGFHWHYQNHIRGRMTKKNATGSRVVQVNGYDNEIHYAV